MIAVAWKILGFWDDRVPARIGPCLIPNLQLPTIRASSRDTPFSHSPEYATDFTAPQRLRFFSRSLRVVRLVRAKRLRDGDVLIPRGGLVRPSQPVHPNGRPIEPSGRTPLMFVNFLCYIYLRTINAIFCIRLASSPNRRKSVPNQFISTRGARVATWSKRRRHGDRGKTLRPECRGIFESLARWFAHYSS